MMNRKILLFVTIVTLTLSKFHAQKPAIVLNDQKGWHRIAETKVSFEKETDEVEVLIADKFASLKFKVKDAAIDLRDLMIYFEDGSEQKITIGSHFKKAGDSSREIDLKGLEEKSIKRIVISYSTVKNSKEKHAHLEIWGKKTNAEKEEHDKKENQKEEHHHRETNESK